MTTIKYRHNDQDYQFSINDDLELKHKNLYLNDDKIFDIFRRHGNIIDAKVVYNDADITEKGRELFKVPDEFTNHVTTVTIAR